MIPTQAERAAVLLALAALCFTPACASPDARPEPSLALPLEDALRRFGYVTQQGGAGQTIDVVVMKDRHAVGAGIFEVDDELRALQRDHRAVVAHLVARGFDLLGCEHALGPLPDNAAASDHRGAIEDARAAGDDLDRWSIYQPLRYAVEFRGRLEVQGVEDPTLYAEDLETLSQIEKTARVRKETGARGARDRAFAAEEARLLARIRANVDARGAAAGRNLAELMRSSGRTRAILLLGASHVPAASAALLEAGVPHAVFEARTFRRRTPQ